MKYRDPATGEFKTLAVAASDTLPIGAEIDFNGTTVPYGWEEITTSPIVESGNNENGDWVKWEDGTMIIHQRYIDTVAETYVTMESLYRVGLESPPDFPIPFVGETPKISITLQNCWLGWLMGMEGEASLTNATNGHYIPIACATRKTFENIVIDIIAIGKWK